MRIDDAIKTLALIEKGEMGIKEQDWMDAVELGIEALERVKLWRETIGHWHARRLPGETEP